MNCNTFLVVPSIINENVNKRVVPLHFSLTLGFKFYTNRILIKFKNVLIEIHLEIEKKNTRLSNEKKIILCYLYREDTVS